MYTHIFESLTPTKVPVYMYIYMCIYKYTYKYIYTHAHTHMYIPIYTCIHVYMYVHTWIRVSDSHEGTCQHMRVQACVGCQKITCILVCQKVSCLLLHGISYSIFFTSGVCRASESLMSSRVTESLMSSNAWCSYGCQNICILTPRMRVSE